MELREKEFFIWVYTLSATRAAEIGESGKEGRAISSCKGRCFPGTLRNHRALKAKIEWIPERSPWVCFLRKKSTLQERGV